MNTPCRRLFLSKVDTDFDVSRDIAAGPWCFIDMEEEVEGWDDLFFTDPFISTSDMVRADALTRRLANQIALSWADRMNILTDRHYSRRMWRNFLIIWMVAAVQTTWRCYCNMELLIKKYRDTPLYVRFLNHNPDWQIDNLTEFMRLLNLDNYFNFWLNSLILRNISPDNWTLDHGAREPYVRPESIEQTTSSKIIKIRNPLSAFIGRLGFDHVQGTKMSRLMFSLIINLLPRLPAKGKKFESDESVIGKFPASYLAILEEFLGATLPLSYSVGLSAILKKVETLKFYPGRLTVTHACSIDTQLHLVSVLSVENGERVVGFQHGGWYGTAATESMATEAEYVYHAFITWGWTEQADFYGNMVPLPSPMLSKIRNAHFTRNESLIFVGTRMMIQNDRFDARPSSVRWLTYRKIKRNFVNTLNSAPRKALLYRPYHRANPPLQDGKYMTRHFPDLPIVEGLLQDSIFTCQLVVLDHPGTTLHIAMAANVPTVCYWDPADWPICSQAKRQFDLLRAAGILFDSPEEAAIRVNEIWDDVSGWWNKPEVRNARMGWVDYHARTSLFWWWHWACGIWRLATGREPKHKGGQISTIK